MLFQSIFVPKVTKTWFSYSPAHQPDKDVQSKDLGRAEYVPVTDREALDAFVWVTQLEGIIPAFETAHAFAELRRRAPELARESLVILNVSGRGDKDVAQARELLRGSR